MATRKQIHKKVVQRQIRKEFVRLSKKMELIERQKSQLEHKKNALKDKISSLQVKCDHPRRVKRENYRGEDRYYCVDCGDKESNSQIMPREEPSERDIAEFWSRA